MKEAPAMKLVTALTVLVGSLFVAGSVRAERTSIWLTQENADNHLYSFTIKVERLKENDVGEFLQFHVTVKPKDAKAPRLPHHSGKLNVFMGKEFVSSCDVQPNGRDGELSFSFRVAAKYAEKSSFMFAEILEHPAGGQGSYYWFYLKDFVEQKEGKLPMIEWGPEKDGVRCAAARPSGVQKVFAGEPIHVLLITKNIDAKPAAVLVKGHPLSVYTISVLGPNGKPTQHTSYGRQQMDSAGEGSRATGSLAPGKEDKSSLLLNRIFDMTQKGEYKVSFSRSVRVNDAEVSVTSNVLTVTVAEEKTEYVPD
jgi:hypothetical protein